MICTTAALKAEPRIRSVFALLPSLQRNAAYDAALEAIERSEASEDALVAAHAAYFMRHRRESSAPRREGALDLCPSPLSCLPPAHAPALSSRAELPRRRKSTQRAPRAPKRPAQDDRR